MAMTPLYGHTSEATAFLVQDYPYGSLRCQIRFWLESTPKKGFRFCSQTENPKNGRWNNPKKSTYSMLGGCMFLDDPASGSPTGKGHVGWSSLTEYSGHADVLSFIQNFPQAVTSDIRIWVSAKIGMLEKLLDGRMSRSINGVKIEPSEGDVSRWTQELAGWKEAEAALPPSEGGLE
jgi:hypothetical protein